MQTYANLCKPMQTYASWRQINLPIAQQRETLDRLLMWHITEHDKSVLIRAAVYFCIITYHERDALMQKHCPNISKKR